MSLVPHPGGSRRSSAIAHCESRPLVRHGRPASGAGVIYDRDQRRRPGDRRQCDRWVYLDLRANRGERRKDVRRRSYDPGRRHWPEPPRGIDLWA